MIGALVVALFTIPTTIKELLIAKTLAAPTIDNANFIKRDEQNALEYLADDQERGSALTRSYLGAVVPGRTGRHTYIGDCLWSEPGCPDRAGTSQALFTRQLSTLVSRRFVQQSGVRFVLAGCETTADMRKLLGPLIRSTHDFGCAAVYEVD